MKRYYEAYDERYKTMHEKGLAWASAERTPIVLDVMERYGIKRGDAILELGCGEGRDARALLERGYSLIAADVSEEAVSFCRAAMPEHKESFRVLDCLRGNLHERYKFIYSVAVIHMLVPDEDRKAFYAFIRERLSEDGLALICTMGDGSAELQSDIRQAFDVQEREHPSGKVMVAATSCRMVSFETFERELAGGGLAIAEKGITASPPEFDSLMYAVVKRA